MGTGAYPANHEQVRLQCCCAVAVCRLIGVRREAVPGYRGIENIMVHGINENEQVTGHGVADFHCRLLGI